MLKAIKGSKTPNSIFGVPYLPNMHLNPVWKANNIVEIDLPFPMRIAWDLSKTVHSIRVHVKVANSFKQAFSAIWSKARYIVKQKHGFEHSTEFYDTEALKLLRELNLDLFAGAFEFRKMKGSNSLSYHSYGIAVDIDSAHHGQGNVTATFPEWYIECWTTQGFTWGGNWSGKKRDSMHFEKTKIPKVT